MHDTHPILAVRNLHISFRGKQHFLAVNNISFNINKGETLAMVGESGSGKSLTALALAGLQPASAQVQGEAILYCNSTTHSLFSLSDKQWQHIRGNEIAMVFQEPMSALNPVMKVGNQLQEVINIHQDITAREGRSKAIEWLEKVRLPGPESLYAKYPHQLSGGQKQRVMIAMAMCNNPALLIADEPTTALDVTVQREIMLLMRELQEQHHTAMLFITHDLALASEMADNVLVLYKGENVEHSTEQKVLHHPVHPYTKALLSSKPSPERKGYKLPTVDDFLQADKSKADTIVADSPGYPSYTSNEKLLEIKNLQVWFANASSWMGKPTGYYKAVNGVSFDLKKGEVLGLVGESGCGKSTISRSLLGLLPVKEGQILFEGRDLTALPQQEWKNIRKKIQMIFQDPYASLNPRLSIGDILMEPMRVHKTVPSSHLQHEALRLLDMVHLPSDTLKRYPHQFSGGQRQRIGIARALSVRPDILICDESVSALDVSVQAQILNLLKELQHEMNLSYLFISHDLSVVHYISDRVLVMQAGKIVESGEAGQVFQHPQHSYTRKLVAAIPELK